MGNSVIRDLRCADFWADIEDILNFEEMFFESTMPEIAEVRTLRYRAEQDCG